MFFSDSVQVVPLSTQLKLQFFENIIKYSMYLSEITQ